MESLSLSAAQQEALDAAVRDVASLHANKAIGSGEQIQFLLSAGWTPDDIVRAVPGLILAPFGEVWGLKDKYVVTSEPGPTVG
jgi:hypothetical protein